MLQERSALFAFREVVCSFESVDTGPIFLKEEREPELFDVLFLALYGYSFLPAKLTQSCLLPLFYFILYFSDANVQFSVKFFRVNCMLAQCHFFSSH